MTSKHPKDWWDEWKPLVEISGLILLAAYTGFTILMYFSNKKSADAAKSAADTAAQQGAFLEVSQRPWIEVTSPSISQQQTIPPVVPLAPYQPMLQNAGYEFAVTVKVYGATPALHSYSKMNPRFMSFPPVVYPFMANVGPPSLDSCSQTASWEDGTSTFFPGGSYPLLSNSQIASTEDLNKLIHAKEALFWVGCVRYEDAFKRRYQTNFCFYWSVMERPVGWARCLTGNNLIEYPNESTNTREKREGHPLPERAKNAIVSFLISVLATGGGFTIRWLLNRRDATVDHKVLDLLSRNAPGVENTISEISVAIKVRDKKVEASLYRLSDKHSVEVDDQGRWRKVVYGKVR